MATERNPFDKIPMGKQERLAFFHSTNRAPHGKIFNKHFKSIIPKNGILEQH